jgi:Family of unknown function (DUF6326)
MESTVNTPREFKAPASLKLSLLWISVMCCYVYGDFFSFFVPGRLQNMMDTDAILDSPSRLFAASVLMTIPSLMIPLSVLMKRSLSRWLNIVFGIIFTGIMLLIAFTSSGAWWSFYIYLAVVESILTAIIVWIAWKWPVIQD